MSSFKNLKNILISGILILVFICTKENLPATKFDGEYIKALWTAEVKAKIFQSIHHLKQEDI